MAARFLKYFFAILIMVAVAIAAFNWLVDPFSLYRSPLIPGFNRDKVEYIKYLRLTKAYQVLRVRPDAVILGTSRSGRGLAPENQAWGGDVVYNLAVPSGSLYENLRLLQHAHAGGRLRKALLGLDFRLFNQSAVNPAFSEDRMLVKATGERNTSRYTTVVADLFGTLLSVDALHSAVNTVRFQGWNAEALYSTGRWDRTNDDYHHCRAFNAYTRASMNRLAGADGPLTGLEDYRRLLRFAHDHDIDLRMFLSPSHVTHWLLLREMGLWPKFQQLKRELVRINIEEASRTGRKAFPIWDFSGANTLSMEPIPCDGDRDGKMKWFWESIHYKSALGNIVMGKVLADESGPLDAEDFGIDLTKIDLESHLVGQSRRLDELTIERSPEAKFVTETVKAYGQQTGS